MADNKFGVQTAYQSVSSSDNDMSDSASNRPKIELGSDSQIKDHRSWWATLLWQTFALLWLVPICALLYLNFTQYIIGASAWCPGGKCYLNAFNLDSGVPQARMRSFNKEDHNLLGGLQFVAKGLEVWFGIIAAALVYLITMRFAGKREGLPVGYLTRPMEFADVIALLDPLLWTTGPTPFGVNKSAGEKKLGRRVWALILLSVFLCLLINFMGPATAVLVIPSLQWIETAQIGDRQFSNLNAGRPPRLGLEGWFWLSTPGCSNEEIRTQNFTCTQWPFGEALDTWTQSALGFGSAATGFTTQSGLTFELNATYQFSVENSLQQLRQMHNTSIISDVVWWAPSRQIVSNLSTDLDAVRYLSWGLKLLENSYYYPDPIETYVEYNKSLELQIRRNGPVLGTTMNKWVDYDNQYHYSIDVDAQRKIRCYIWYNLWNAQMTEGVSSTTSNYTKCIRTGSGWSDVNKQTNFFVPGAYDTISKKQGPSVAVDIYASDRAVFLPNGTLPSWLPKVCLARGGALNRTTCDWNRLFTTNISPDVANRTQYVNTIEFQMSNGNYSTTMAADFVAYSAWTTYTLDPFPYSNPLGLVQTEQLPRNGTPVAVDPAWLLAGWSVGPGGSLLSNRTTSNLLVDVMSRILANPGSGGGVDLGLYYGDYKIDLVSFLPSTYINAQKGYSNHLAGCISERTTWLKPAESW